MTFSENSLLIELGDECVGDYQLLPITNRPIPGDVEEADEEGQQGPSSKKTLAAATSSLPRATYSDRMVSKLWPVFFALNPNAQLGVRRYYLKF